MTWSLLMAQLGQGKVSWWKGKLAAAAASHSAYI